MITFLGVFFEWPEFTPKGGTASQRQDVSFWVHRFSREVSRLRDVCRTLDMYVNMYIKCPSTFHLTTAAANVSWLIFLP